jgi:hypothetical protein
MPWRRHSSLMEIWLVMYSRSSLAKSWRLFVVAAFGLHRPPASPRRDEGRSHRLAQMVASGRMREGWRCCLDRCLSRFVSRCLSGVVMG